MTSAFQVLRVLTGGLALACLAIAADRNPAPMAAGSAAVEIDGAKFTMADIERKNGGGLFQARNAVFDAERKAADEFINDYVLRREAEKEHLAVEELLKARAYNSIQEPSEEALRVYYDGLDTSESYEAVRDKIRDVIRQRRMAKAKTAYIKTLRSKASVQVRLAPPRIGLAGGAPTRGAATPKVSLVEFADYECPYCQQIQPVIARVEAEYKGQLAFTFKDAPLPMHASAQKAAEAAHCAGAQGKFWEYHDVLFESRQLSVADLRKHARTLNLNGGAFDQCLDSGATAARVKASLDEAQAVGLPGTPGFFVNGRFLKGAVDYQTLRQMIEEELSALASAPAKELAASRPQ